MRPRVILSRCLEVEACRYNGAGIRSAVVRGLAPFVEFVAVCPEVEIGLGVPRDPIRIEATGQGRGYGHGQGHGQGGTHRHTHRDPGVEGELRLVQPSTGRDLTGAMRGFGHGFADEVSAVDGAILKSRSPSCGLGDVKVFAGEGDALETTAGDGMFAAVLRERFPELAMEDEARLTEAAARHVWLARVFASARRRSRAEDVGDDGVGESGGGFPPEVEAAVVAAIG